MNPSISNISEEDDIFKFTLSGINVSLANALRRTIVSDIPTVVFYTENHKDNQCNITVNTTRLHNEILKQRLSCIPVHIKELDVLPENYVLELDVTNDTENTIIVTTEDFKIRNKSNGNYLTDEETHRIFPANRKTNMYIDFARLKPKISDTIPGEQLTLTAEFSIHTAKDSSMFNVVSKCAYENTPDMAKIKGVWEDQEKKLKSENMNNEDIEYNKRNFMILDAQRHFVPDSFNYVVQTVGVFENLDIIKKACAILQSRFTELIAEIDSDIVPINISETTIENCYDVILEDGDYSIGKTIEYILYEQYYLGEKTLTYCGFKKMHPHNPESTLRLAYKDPADKRTVSQYLRTACVESANIFARMYKLF